jgi:hypothetical protein
MQVLESENPSAAEAVDPEDFSMFVFTRRAAVWKNPEVILAAAVWSSIVAFVAPPPPTNANFLN